ncbi:MAG TPA: CAP domain-containing protein [Campylobacterales bacterium]|nr:CAP domain-containing protein [Campylobacterales bacterium]
MNEMEYIMKQKSNTYLLGGLALFAIYLYYLSATPLPPKLEIKKTPTLNVTQEENLAFGYLNSLRVGAGLIPFHSHPQLNQAARNHANYLSNHLTYGHKQDKKHHDFTGEFASSRVTYVGYSAPQVIENVSTHNPDYKASINGLFSAIYHRFAFLDFRSDTIGIGVSQNRSHLEQTAFVYNMSSLALEVLYKQPSPVTSEKIQKALDVNKQINSKVVLYPFPNQTEVPPAFFDELPDPLPEHKVSGFPISVSFNSFYHKEGKLLKFQLFDEQGNEITNTLKYDHKSDPNKRLEKLDFVLFPLDRLEWNRRYHVKFLAIVDNRIVKKEWSFSTQKFNLPLHIVKHNHQNFKIKQKNSHIFYFPPKSKVDLLSDIAYPSNLDIEFIDKNTIKLTVLAPAKKRQRLLIGNYQLTLDTVK